MTYSRKCTYRTDEVETAVDSVVLNIPPVEAALIFEKLLELAFDVIRDRLPTAVVVHCVPKA